MREIEKQSKRRYEATSRNTENMLAHAFVELLKGKPVRKITIQDITEYCGVNRKTFYYHFSSIEELVLWMLKKEAMETFQGLETCEDPEQLLRVIVTFSMQKKQMFEAVCTMNWQIFHTTLYDAFHRVVRLLLERFERERGMRLEEDYRNYVVDFYCEALTANLFQYLQKEEADSFEIRIQYMLKLVSVSLKAILDRE